MESLVERTRAQQRQMLEHQMARGERNGWWGWFLGRSGRLRREDSSPGELVRRQGHPEMGKDQGLHARKPLHAGEGREQARGRAQAGDPARG
jgi:hypothetical protein